MNEREKTTKQDIGLSIKNLRQKKGLRQKDLAKRTNPNPVTTNTISRIETGYHNYYINILFRIADALDCDVADFFQPKEKKSPKVMIFEGTIEELLESKILEKK